MRPQEASSGGRSQWVAAVPLHTGVVDQREEVAKPIAVGMELHVVAEG
jgi:hypothetical protein